MRTSKTIDFYNKCAKVLAEQYESVLFEQIYESVLDFLPTTPSLILDIGAGSGRDAAWFARKGHDVIAVEPAALLLEEARRLHSEPNIRWLQDKLPGLENTLRLSCSFDLILVNAVWMHISPDERPRAFRKLVSLLSAGGRMIISLRHGTFDDGRTTHPVSLSEIEHLAVQHGIAVQKVCKSEDRLQRSDVAWETVCIRLPDDGTEALPLLRHTILNDSKSSTYKLALLRILVRIADSAVGLARDCGDEYVSVPLGLVALYWIRMYQPLIYAGIPQMPANKDQRDLAFVKESFNNLRNVSAYDLRIGARFSGADAAWLHGAMLDARNTIHNMPAHYLTYPNSSEQIFKSDLAGKLIRSVSSFVIDESYLATFGEMRVPRHLWLAMSRFTSWIEPALMTEWVRLMQFYCEGHGKQVTYGELMQSLQWIEPLRDTMRVRVIAEKILVAEKPLYCVWSGKRLQQRSLDIDHCFPFAAWPCGDLWNLMPTHRQVNQSQKQDKLVTAQTLHQAEERLFEWWEGAYIKGENSVLLERFIGEAKAALPLADLTDLTGPAESIFDGLLIKRAILKRDLQLADWDFQTR